MIWVAVPAVRSVGGDHIWLDVFDDGDELVDLLLPVVLAIRVGEGILPGDARSAGHSGVSPAPHSPEEVWPVRGAVVDAQLVDTQRGERFPQLANAVTAKHSGSARVLIGVHEVLVFLTDDLPFLAHGAGENVNVCPHPRGLGEHQPVEERFIVWVCVHG